VAQRLASLFLKAPRPIRSSIHNSSRYPQPNMSAVNDIVDLDGLSALLGIRYKYHKGAHRTQPQARCARKTVSHKPFASS